MAVSEWIGGWRSWFPVPTRERGVQLGRWILLEGNRYAVTAALLSLTFAAFVIAGKLWTLPLHRLLVETGAVQSVLTTFMSGIILLVSIVVSINSIILSYDITHVNTQRERIEGTMEFRRELGRLAETEDSPTDPNAFLGLMAEVIQRRAEALESVAEGADEEFARSVKDHAQMTGKTASYLERSLNRAREGEFGVLWLGLEADYGPLMDESRQISARFEDRFSEDTEKQFEELMAALELFATGREYFKTLYYSREVSELSRTLLLISLPSILVTAVTILAINARLLPDLWLFGLSPLLTFVAITMTVSLAPFLVLVAYMLRVATVARRTAAAGPFVLQP